MRFRVFRLSLASILVLMLPALAAAQAAPEPIGYTLRFPAPHTHYV